VDNALVSILTDGGVSREIHLVLLELVAMFSKEKRDFPANVTDAAKTCALTAFSGDLDEPVPAMTL